MKFPNFSWIFSLYSDCTKIRQKLKYLKKNIIFYLNLQISEIKQKNDTNLTKVTESAQLMVPVTDTYSTPRTSGVCQARCWPPSTHNNCPVTAGASMKYPTAAVISSTFAPRCKMVFERWLEKWWSDWRLPWSVGPGPMAFTLICGASPCAEIVVKAHRPIFAIE